MIFKALPVNVGDSFYLENDGNRILVDGGMNQKHIVKLLNKENITNKHFDVLICTHYDADHIKGILGILKSKRYTFKELWLPEILGSIGYSITQNINEIIKKIRQFETIDIEEFSKPELPSNLESTLDQLEELDFNFLKKVIQFRIPHSRYFYGLNEIQTKLLFTLHKISNLISLSYASGTYVRWFKFQDQLLHKQVNFNLYAKNCIQVALTKYSSQELFQALLKITLTKINAESLVFQYSKPNFPDVLFTADSGLDFCRSKQIILKEHSIVTAPHHGSSANDSAYGFILGEHLTYVRSDRGQVLRPGKGFLSVDNRYCTICRNKTEKSKVELKYNGSSFTTYKKACIC